MLRLGLAKSCWSFQKKRCRRWIVGAELEAEEKQSNEIKAEKQRGIQKKRGS